MARSGTLLPSVKIFSLYINSMRYKFKDEINFFKRVLVLPSSIPHAQKSTNQTAANKIFKFRQKKIGWGKLTRTT
jgi:hypothetical protein